jgi:methionyl-tRNA synthetase
MTDEIKKEEAEVKVNVVVEPKITYDDFKKVEIKIGQILTVERIEKSEKLLKLSVDFKEEGGPRQILSGIAKYFPNIEDLIGKKCPFVTNLEPKPLMGLESNGMILAVGGGDDPFSLFEVADPALVGKRIK